MEPTLSMAVRPDDDGKPRLFRPWILYPQNFPSSAVTLAECPPKDPRPTIPLIPQPPSLPVALPVSVPVGPSMGPSVSGFTTDSTRKCRKQRPKKFRCPHCHVSFSNNGQLKGHVRIHTGERPFKCECGKTFTRNEELTRHKRIHSGLRPFPCQVCGKRFGRKDHLKKHVKTHQRPTQMAVNPAALLPPGIALYSYYLKDSAYLHPHLTW